MVRRERMKRLGEENRKKIERLEEETSRDCEAQKKKNKFRYANNG